MILPRKKANGIVITACILICILGFAAGIFPQFVVGLMGGDANNLSWISICSLILSFMAGLAAVLINCKSKSESN